MVPVVALSADWSHPVTTPDPADGKPVEAGSATSDATTATSAADSCGSYSMQGFYPVTSSRLTPMPVSAYTAMKPGGDAASLSAGTSAPAASSNGMIVGPANPIPQPPATVNLGAAAITSTSNPSGGDPVSLPYAVMSSHLTLMPPLISDPVIGGPIDPTLSLIAAPVVSNNLVAKQDLISDETGTGGGAESQNAPQISATLGSSGNHLAIAPGQMVVSTSQVPHALPEVKIAQSVTLTPVLHQRIIRPSRRWTPRPPLRPLLSQRWKMRLSV